MNTCERLPASAVSSAQVEPAGRLTWIELLLGVVLAVHLVRLFKALLVLVHIHCLANVDATNQRI